MPRDEATPPLIERERELRALTRALEQARDGVVSTLLLVGEPGLGKSRLLRTVAGDHGALVLRGYALEPDTPTHFPLKRALAAAERGGLRLTLAACSALRGDTDRALGLLNDVEAFASRNGLDYDVADTRRIRIALDGGAAAAVAFGRPDAPPAAARLQAASPAGLSSRELQVLQLVAKGLSNREIAGRLWLSERTVVNHVSHIFSKIGVENRAGATAFAFRSGLSEQQ